MRVAFERHGAELKALVKQGGVLWGDGVAEGRECVHELGGEAVKGLRIESRHGHCGFLRTETGFMCLWLADQLTQWS